MSGDAGPMAIGSVFQRLREESGWSQTAVANRAGGTLRQSDISRIENGERIPRRKTIERLAAVYGLTADEVIARARNRQQPTGGRLPATPKTLTAESLDGFDLLTLRAIAAGIRMSQAFAPYGVKLNHRAVEVVITEMLKAMHIDAAMAQGDYSRTDIPDIPDQWVAVIARAAAAVATALTDPDDLDSFLGVVDRLVQKNWEPSGGLIHEYGG